MKIYGVQTRLSVCMSEQTGSSCSNIEVNHSLYWKKPENTTLGNKRGTYFILLQRQSLKRKNAFDRRTPTLHEHFITTHLQQLLKQSQHTASEPIILQN
ncbi:hypothetical protein JZ751_007905 [Albula glossodonta]|uniref:Uncharacterized protein n=1 Tax=Albula glossodonta TaxID=121402 RepID=A0A8T2PBL3_9TELE|nr:hypothetical protein JZ751_007905 [Albula glossodonta]